MKKIAKRSFLELSLIFFILFVFSACDINNNNLKIENNNNDSSNIDKVDSPEEVVDFFDFLEQTYYEGESYITYKSQINLIDTDGNKKNYIFNYNRETYIAVYTKDNWHINDSYKIKNKSDIKNICQALIDIHPVHGVDMKSYRSAEDMMYEWVEHNIAYDYLPDGNSWKKHAKDVDLNPADQGKSLKELYESRAN